MRTVLTAAAVVTAIALSACSHSDRSTSRSTATAMAAMPATDTQFAQNAARGDAGEILTARLALQRAGSADVRQFAQQMIQDHTTSTQRLTAIATAKGMVLPTDPDPDAQALAAQISGLQGAEFDRAYMQGQVQLHQKMQGVFQTEIQGGSDAQLRNFAQQTLPTIQMHLQMAQRLASSL